MATPLVSAPLLGTLARAVDRFISRDDGLDAWAQDRYHPGPDAGEVARLLDVAREARFPERAPPFRSALPHGHPENEVIRVALDDAPADARWAILAPPYGALARDGAAGLYALHARALRQAGYAVALYPLPFHGARAVANEASGWGLVRADLRETVRAMAESAADAGALARWLAARGAREVAGFGVSLGGHAVALAAALGAPIARLALLAPVDSAVSFYWTGGKRESLRRAIARGGGARADVEAAFAPFAPSSYARPCPTTFAVPPHDLIVPTATQVAWRAKWDGASVPMPALGHATAIASPAVAARLARALAGSAR